jgi:hypothetical protein
MGNVTTSKANNINSPNGNSLAVFVDGDDDVMKIKDVRGNVQELSDYIVIPTTPSTLNYGLFSQTNDSTPITATTQELSLVGVGVGTLFVPANGFSIGDSFEANLIGILSCVGTAQLDIRIKTTDGVLLADTQIVNMDLTTNKKWRLNIMFTIRQVGESGTATIVSGGLFSYNKNSGNNFDGANFSTRNDSTFDTTISNTLIVTAQWNTNNASNSIYSEIFTLNKIF